MVYISIIIGCIIGALIGINAPVISYTYSSYLSIAIIAALDTVFGGIASVIKKNFDLSIFLRYSALSTKYGRPVHSRLSGSVTIFLAGEIIILSIYVPQKHFMNIL